MVRVPAGEYTVGSDVGPDNVRPAHQVRIGAFMIDRYEVTNRMYLQFIRATNHPAPPRWVADSTILGRTDRLPFNEDQADLPVTYVSWLDAASYAAWRGCRLPSEAEWEVAARCSTSVIYPWGADTTANGMRAANAIGGVDGYEAGPAPVGSFPSGRSCWGVDDLVGNVWEWTADWYLPAAYHDVPIASRGEAVTDSLFGQRVIRGGSWFDAITRTNVHTRTGFDPAYKSDIVGFRCARDVE
jgi:formylglycine-generating enzyme required for sulfatase activity